MAVPTLTRRAHTTPPLKAVDVAGRVWAHHNPAELYRWVSRRNELLRAIDAAPTPAHESRSTPGAR
jgi:hypothetical protein